MSKGIKKRYIVLIIVLATILLVSLLGVFIKLGTSSYKKNSVSDEIKPIEVKVTSKKSEDTSLDKNLDSDEFKSNLYSFEEDELSGFKNSYGEVVIKPKYGYIGEFSEGLIAVTIEGKFGYIDSKENVIIKEKYAFANNFKNGLAIVNLDGKKEAVIDKEGNELFITENYELHKIVGEYILASEKNNEYHSMGYLNKKGEKVGKLKYDRISEFKDGYAKVESNGMYGLINEKGDEVIPLVYNNIEDFSEGYAVLADKNDHKLIDKSLEEVKFNNLSFDCTFRKYVNGIIIVDDLNTFESVILNNKLEEAFRIPYDYYFSDLCKANTLVFYNREDCATFTDINGNVKFEIDNVEYINQSTSGDYFIIEKMGKKKGHGVIDIEGNQIVPFKYSDIEEKNGFFICTNKGIINEKLDIYYGNKKLNNRSIKSDFAYFEGEGVVSVDENGKIYYLNKYGQKFLKRPR